jgi:hypothetical protein
VQNDSVEVRRGYPKQMSRDAFLRWARTLNPSAVDVLLTASLAAVDLVAWSPVHRAPAPTRRAQASSEQASCCSRPFRWHGVGEDPCSSSFS